ncbi:short-chain dehydrogenase [Saccharobesus litoralis]|uniref:Short-chain dehydrogenase n=1 Tax=Saccharobesus litoralis TaxID=2172099 RepID=A0A2S0VLZ9_9ALTE|nr:SDR family oxidoreductase [Saccharobesus litoralis]AWB65244.1 short-chain dehydrogenase [Saccharobesus litoralis]
MPTILITGANRGIGLEFVRHYLAQPNNRVIATCRQPDAASELNKLAHTNKHLNVVPLDISNPKSIQQLQKELANQPIDLLINNAGMYGPKGLPRESVSTQDWLNVFQVNSIAPFMVTNALLDNLKQVKNAKIAYLTSKMGSMTDNNSGGSYIYRSSKAALNAVIKSLSIDLRPDNIQVVALHPGWVKTEMGGPNALITTQESVAGLTQVIENLTSEQSGQFINFDGTSIPW